MISSSKLSGLTALALSAMVAILTGCAGAPEDPTAGWSPNKIYSEAKDAMETNAFDKAIPLYEKLEGRAAGTPLAQQAELEKAYAQYKSGEPAQALATLARFTKLHPASAGLDYALYLKGIVNFNDNMGVFASFTRQDLAERDQKASKESFDAFKELVQRFPESRYAPDARLRMNYIVNSLARYEVHVARYYFDRGAYVAAANRAQSSLTDYREVPASEEALYITMRSYEELGLTQLSDDARRVLEKNFPQSQYLKKR